MIIEAVEEIPKGLLSELDLDILVKFINYLKDDKDSLYKNSKDSKNVAMHAILMLLQQESITSILGVSRQREVNSEVLILSVFMASIFDGYENMSSKEKESDAHKNFSLINLAFDDEDKELSKHSTDSELYIKLDDLRVSKNYSTINKHLLSVANEFRSSNYVFKPLQEGIMYHDYIFPTDESILPIQLTMLENNRHDKPVFRLYTKLCKFKKSSTKKETYEELMKWSGLPSSRCKVAIFNGDWIICVEQLVSTLDGDEVLSMINDVSSDYKVLEKLFL